MVGDPGEFGPHGADPFGPRRDVDVEQLLDGEAEALLVDHHGYIVQPVEVGESLRRRRRRRRRRKS